MSERAESAPAEAPPAAPATGWPERLAALRDAGAGQADPVRWRFIEALARRAQQQQGRARALLDQRLDQLLAAGPPTPRPGAPAAHAPSPARARPSAPAPGPLGRLVASLAAEASAAQASPDAAALASAAAAPAPASAKSPRAPSAASAPPAPAAPRGATPPLPPAGGAAGPGELKAARLFGRGWAQLAAERQVRQAQATLPAQTGPLNSQRLVLQALQRLQALSPDHLARLLAEVEALRWLARAEAADPQAAPAPAGAKPRRATAPAPRRPAGRR